MKVSVILAGEIDEDQRQKWRAIQADNPSIDNPYFSIEYTQAVAAVRDDVFVGVMEEDNKVIGFFPFQVERQGIASPVGGRMSDYQGLIISRQQRVDIRELLSGCGLHVWEFNSVPAEQGFASSYHKKTSFSPRMNLSQGFEEYKKRVRKFGGRIVKNTGRKGRKLEREVGELQFDLFSDDKAAFDQLIAWKRQQCKRMGEEDFLTWGWTTDLLEQVLKTQTAHFRGALSVLRTKDEIVGAEISMHSETVCHCWFTAYNHQFYNYSPGSQLLLRMAQALPDEGVEWIDLGNGKEEYKASVATDQIDVVGGFEMLPSVSSGNYVMRRGVNVLRKDVWWPTKNRFNEITQSYLK